MSDKITQEDVARAAWVAAEADLRDTLFAYHMAPIEEQAIKWKAVQTAKHKVRRLAIQ